MTQRDLPKPREVWGVPDQPETWRRVDLVIDGNMVYYDTWAGWNRDGMKAWLDWIAESVAVRIYPPMESSDDE